MYLGFGLEKIIFESVVVKIFHIVNILLWLSFDNDYGFSPDLELST